MRKDACTGQKCPEFQECFLTAMRQRAQEADLIIVNHHLFFADLALKQDDFGSILRFAENNFGFFEGQLGLADSRASTDLSAFFHLDQSPRRFTNIAAPKDAAFFINDTRPPEPPDND